MIAATLFVMASQSSHESLYVPGRSAQALFVVDSKPARVDSVSKAKGTKGRGSNGSHRE